MGGNTVCGLNHTADETRCLQPSLPLGPRLHFHPARAGRRPAPLREGVGAVEPDTERGEDLDQRDEHVGGAERREPGEHRGGEDVAGEEGGV